MKNEPTDLEKYQAIRIEALETALKEAQSDLIRLHIETNDVSKQAKAYADKIKEHVNNPDFHKPIQDIEVD